MFILFSVLGTVRKIGMWIDSVAYGLIDNAYNLIVTFSTNEFFSNGTVQKVMRSSYVIMAIFALFRLALILVNTMINPDKLTDSKDGAAKVGMNVVIMFVLLIVTPIVFSHARDLQSFIVTNNYVQKVFGLGMGQSNFADDGTVVDDEYNPGEGMKKIAISASVYPDSRLYDKTTGDFKEGCNQKCQDIITDYNTMMEGDYKLDYSFLTYGVSESVKVDGEEIYILTYQFLLNLGVGLFVTYILFSFAIDIAVRSVELAMLELLSPMFIVTYIDPKSAKSGAFHNWLTTTGKTYISLFIKLAIVSIMLVFISAISDPANENIFKNKDVGFMAKVLLLFAILIFAKKAPTWISGLIGIKSEDTGLGGLSLAKKLGGAALVGGLVTKGIDKAKEKAKQTGRRAVNNTAAKVGGTLGGARAAMSGALGDKSFKNIRDQKRKETGSTVRAHAAAAKSFFSAKDWKARNDALSDNFYGNLERKPIEGDPKGRKSSAIVDKMREGRAKAKLDGFNAAVDGKMIGVLGAAQGVRQAFDTTYQSAGDRKKSIAEDKYYADKNQRGFNAAEINKQKKIKSDLAESRKVLNVQTYADEEGNIYTENPYMPDPTDPARQIINPAARRAIWDEKSLKKVLKNDYADYGDYGAYRFLNDPSISVAKADTRLTLTDNAGNSFSAVVPAGTMYKTDASTGQSSILMSNHSSFKVVDPATGNVVTDASGNAVTRAVNTSAVTTAINGGSINYDATGNGSYNITFNNGNKATVTLRRDATTNEVTGISTDGGTTFTDVKPGENLTDKVLEVAAKTELGGEESFASRTLDAAIAAVQEQSAARAVSYEENISQTRTNIADLTRNLTELRNGLSVELDATEWGKREKEKEQLKSQNAEIKRQSSVIEEIFANGVLRDFDTIVYNGSVLSAEELREKFQQLKLVSTGNENAIKEIEKWESDPANRDAKNNYEEKEKSLKKRTKALEDAIADEEKALKTLQEQRDEIGTIIFEGKEITSANYETYKPKMEQATTKKKKLAENASFSSSGSDSK